MLKVVILNNALSGQGSCNLANSHQFGTRAGKHVSYGYMRWAMNHIYLERHDPDKNLHRFYQMYVTPDIFGDWSLVHEWGRRWSSGTARKDWLATKQEAINAGQKLSEVKLKKVTK